MIDIEVCAHAPGRQIDDVYHLLRDFASYPSLTEVVRAVEVTRLDDDLAESRWEVDFRGGVLQWTETDRFDDVARTITFQQISGDLGRFDGGWRVSEHETGVLVHFEAVLDLGMPSIAALLDPVAARTLRQTTEAILRGVLGTEVAFPPVGDPVMRATAATPAVLAGLAG